MRFEFDSSKAASNLRKHGVSFTEATTAFADPQSAEFADDAHTEQEERWILIGIPDHRRTSCYRT